MKKILKWGLIGFVVLIVIGAIGSSSKGGSTSQPSSSTNTSTLQPSVSAAPKQWVTVIELSGNSNKRSDIFTLKGGKAKLTYTFKGASSIVGGIYVVGEGHSIQKEGGIPEVMVTQPGTDSTFLTNGAGNYYLDISSANASWTIKVEEER